jgi:uncharacterized protein
LLSAGFPYRINLPKMSIIQQIFHLQDLDIQIEAAQQALARMKNQVGESAAMLETRAELTNEKQHLEALKKQQRELETESGDVTARLKTGGDELYSGRIKNPKELSNLQQDIELLKSKRGKMDDKVLELMDEVELHTKKSAEAGIKFGKIEAEWKIEQEKLKAEIEKTQGELASAAEQKTLLLSHLETKVITLYNELKIKRKTAVAKVNQGICSGCRTALPAADLNHARSGQIVQCSSCGRILYLA